MALIRESLILGLIQRSVFESQFEEIQDFATYAKG